MSIFIRLSDALLYQKNRVKEDIFCRNEKVNNNKNLFLIRFLERTYRLNLFKTYTDFTKDGLQDFSK